MKRFFVLLIVSAMLLSAFALVSSAESFVDEEDIVVDLMPTKELIKTPGLVDAHNCELSFDIDGSLVITITGIDPYLSVKWVDGSTIYAGGNIDLSEPAYFCVDYGVTGKGNIVSAGTSEAGSTIFFYTRKDKAASGTYAQLWYTSMAESADYVSYRTQGKKDEHGAYVVWDWGKYINDGAATKLFDDKIHQFVSMQLPLTGDVGDTVVLYSLCVTSTGDPHGLGDVRPDPKKEESSEEPAPAESSEEPAPAESSEEPAPAESSEEPAPAESSEEPAPAESSEEPAPAESSEEPAPAESSEEPAPAESSEEPAPAESSGQSAAPESSEETPAQSGGFPWWGWLLIGVGAVAVVGIVIGIVLKGKKK